MKAVILAAGFGTRLYPLTTDKPKALLELGGKTLLDRLMEKLEPIKAIQEVTLVTNGRFYLDFFRWRKSAPYRKSIRIQDNTAYHPEKRLGAVRDLYLGLTAKKAPQDDFLVLLGDNYFDFPLSHFHLHLPFHPRSPLIGLYDLKDKEKAKSYGVVELDSENRIVSFEEKPCDPKSAVVSLGVYYFPKEFRLRFYEYLQIERLDPDRMGDFIAWLAKKDALCGLEFDGTWFDIGSLDAYEEARRHFDGRLNS